MHHFGLWQLLHIALRYFPLKPQCESNLRVPDIKIIKTRRQNKANVNVHVLSVARSQNVENQLSRNSIKTDTIQAVWALARQRVVNMKHGCSHSTTFAKPMKLVRTKRQIWLPVWYVQTRSLVLYMVLINFEGLGKTSKINKDQVYMSESLCCFCTWSLLILKVWAKPSKNIRTKCKNAKRYSKRCLVLMNFTGFGKTFKISKD